jgi:hypothetical protein
MVARVFSVGSDIVLYPFLVSRLWSYVHMAWDLRAPTFTQDAMQFLTPPFSENGRVPELPLPQDPD